MAQQVNALDAVIGAGLQHVAQQLYGESILSDAIVTDEDPTSKTPEAAQAAYEQSTQQREQTTDNATALAAEQQRIADTRAKINGFIDFHRALHEIVGVGGRDCQIHQTP